MNTNLWLLVEPSLKKNQHLTAWICRGKSSKKIVTYGQIYDAVLTTACELRKQNIGIGDTVGITAPNGPEWSVAALASWKLGAAIAPIHIGNSDHDIANQITALNPKVMMICESDCLHHNLMQISLQKKDASIAAESAITVPHTDHKVAVRIYTSGSTGTPKIVRLSHNNHVSNVLSACNIKSFSNTDRFVSLLPFSHAMGLTANLLLPYYRGGIVVTPRVLAASEVMATLAEEKISVLIAVPRLFRNIMNGLEQKFAQASPVLRCYVRIIRFAPQWLKPYLNSPIRKKLGGNIRVWVSGGSHLDSTIAHYFQTLGLPLRQGYGLTETAPLSSIQEEYDASLESVGKAIDGVDIRIHEPDSDGRGEVHILGPNVMLGYENQQHNDDAFDGKWFKTGDIGKLDASNRLILTGRSKRLIVTEAGKNVYPEELEILLERDPRIREAGVFELDMKPACVVSSELDENQVRLAIKQFNLQVSRHNQITQFAITDELPRTPLGKLAIQSLAEVFEQHRIT